MSARDPIRDVFNEEALRRLCRSSATTEEVKRRLEILGACGPRPSDAHAALTLRHARAWKAAWEAYLTAAFCCGLFEDAAGRDLRARLTSARFDDFRSAMAECLVSWFLSSRFGWTVIPRPQGRPGRVLELRARVTGGQEVNIEVKAPFVPTPTDSWSGDDGEVLAGCLDEANKQFAESTSNLLVIVPKLRLAAFDHRYQVVRTFIAEEKIEVSFLSGGGAAVIGTGFSLDGKFLKRWPDRPRFTRTSAVVCIEERLVPQDMSAWIEHRCIVVHNPYAKVKLPTDIWGQSPQFLEDGDSWRWSDGRGLHP